MKGRAVVVLDCGKTLSKLSLWSPDGALIERRSRANQPVETGDYIALDSAGIESWLAGTLTDFGRIGDIGAIVPVAHGAACAVISGRPAGLPSARL